MADNAYIQPRAAWKLTLDGEDLTPRMVSLLIDLRLIEKRAESSDELEIRLNDHDGKVVLPPEGARLNLSLGWERGTGIAIGLQPKGSFRVDEVSWEGPPDVVTIRARSADFESSFRKRRSKVWKDMTIGAMIDRLANNHGLTARCHADLVDTVVTAIEQANKSDMTFLRDLGRRYDAIATVKNRHLIFAPVDADTTATGKVIPSITLRRGDGDRYSFHRASRERAQDGAEANWHDQSGASRRIVTRGGSNRRRLKRVYASENDANAAVMAETKRLKRAEASMELTMAYGNPAIAAGARATVSGFKSEIDARSWRIAGVEHEMGPRGYFTKVELEAMD